MREPTSRPQTLMDCSRVADRLPLEALAREWGRKPPPRGGALTLEGKVLAAAVRRESAPGRAFLYANGCLVTAGMEPRDTQSLALQLAHSASDADLARMLLLREVRTVPDLALEAQARALAGSVVLDTLERQTELLLAEAGRNQPGQRRMRRAGWRRSQRMLGQAVAFRYQCVHGHGALDRPDAGWDQRQRAAYRRLAGELQLSARAALLSHKLDRLEEILLNAGELGRVGGARRQLWLEVCMLAFFPLARLVAALAAGRNGFAWLQPWLRGLRLFE